MIEMDERYRLKPLRHLQARMKREIERRKETPKTARGPKSELLVRVKLGELGFLTCKGPEGFVDIIALALEGEVIKFPLKTIGVEVNRVGIRRAPIHIADSKIAGKYGPFYVITVEIDFGDYVYLVLTYSEMKQITKKKGHFYAEDPRKRKRWFLRIPKNLAGTEFEEYTDRWDKIVDYTCT